MRRKAARKIIDFAFSVIASFLFIKGKPMPFKYNDI